VTLVVCFLAAVAGARTPASQARSKPPAPAALPDDLVLPYPATAPALVGPTAVLSLDGLDRDRFTFRMQADLTPLQSPSAATVDAVFARLAADPRWRVGRDGAGRVAFLRTGSPPGIGPDGWSITDDACFRVAIRAGSDSDDRWTNGAQVSRVPAGAGAFGVDGFRPEGGACGPLATALRVEGGLSVEVFESGATTARPVTVAALTDVAALVRDVAASHATATAPVDPLDLPPGEPREGIGADLTVAAAGPGQLAVSGRVDPGEPGVVWVRLLDAQGVAWEEQAVAAGTLEQAGWSTRPWVGFYVASRFAVPPGAAFEVTAEWWFHGDAGSHRRLLAVPVTVPSR
jgi:hypothetical protein